MQPVNLKSMFATASKICGELMDEEEVNVERVDRVLKSVEVMNKCIESAIKLTALSLQNERFRDSWSSFNPQLKNYDALPE